MPGRHPNARHKADTSADPIIALAIERGYLNSDTPFDVPLPGHEAANKGRLSINRSARRQNLSPAAWVAGPDGEPCNPARTPCPDPEGPHYVRFRLWAKNAGRVHVFRQSGGDPANLKYNPWARKGPRYDDTGQQVS